MEIATESASKTSQSVSQDIHPDIQRAIDAIHLPEVQDIIKQLSKHGLAVSVPHMHGDRGNFIPLPHGKVSFEDGLRVSFRDASDPAVQSGMAVGWRWNNETETVARCDSCSGACCFRVCETSLHK